MAPTESKPAANGSGNDSGEEKVFTVDEIAKHRTYEDCWLILGEPGEQKVYDCTGFLDDHPGGPEILMDLAGQNAHEEFEDIGHSKDAREMLADLYIGKVKEPENAGTKKAPESAGKGSQVANGSSNSSFLLILGAVLAILVAFFVYPVD